jgi:uncharacterized cupredoxin-like copper-binding protein
LEEECKEGWRPVQKEHAVRRLLVLAAAAFASACASSHPIEPRLAPASVSFAGATEQRVELANFDFTPREVHLRAGQPYELVLVNIASGGHDFAAPEFFAAGQVRPDEAALVAEGEIEVPGGATRRIHIVPAAGRYDLVCTHTGHALLGMKGRIVVE